MKYKLINDWTKESLMERILEKNSFAICTSGRGDRVYRNDEGKACFAGVFIPDELYSKAFEGKVVDGIIQIAPALLNYFPFGHEGMAALQNIHDSQWAHSDVNLKSRVQDFLDQECV